MAESVTIDLARIAAELGLKASQVEKTVALLDADNTVPFITRYRKEETGHLDEEAIRAINERVQTERHLLERAQNVLRLIDSQGKLTPELEAAIKDARTLKRLDDLYLPFRPKRRSRAEMARQRGLLPFANAIWHGEIVDSRLDAAAREVVGRLDDVEDAESALRGASDILAERMSEDPDLRETVRQFLRRDGNLSVAATTSGKTAGHDFKNYFDFSERLSRIPPHRTLAINRGERSGALRVRVAFDMERVLERLVRQLGHQQHPCRFFLKTSLTDALQRLVHPSLEREFRRELTERAERHAIDVFGRNLRNLLLQPPVKGESILAIDPGFRTGCKVAVLDPMGTCICTDVIYVTGSAEKREAGQQRLIGLLNEHTCSLIAIGNGTACRECEELIAAMIAEHDVNARYLIVNEAGASIYSTSTVAREELPDFDATERGTISIGRRVLDPLSELVKIDPQHIGVGMYQHDVNDKSLQEALTGVVESCVNFVGVDLNTASASLLAHVSGLNHLLARRVVDWRDENGRFRNRAELLDVTGIGPAIHTQSAGFLKVNGGDEPLDQTWIHPESYAATRKLMDHFDWTPDAISTGTVETPQESIQSQDKLAHEIGVGETTLSDILDALTRPALDPRSELPPPVFKRGVLKLDDLQVGLELSGSVLNVVDFGVFVDIGLKDSGLVHISQMSRDFVKSPHDLVAVGDVVTVWVLNVDQERRRVALTMVPPDRSDQPVTAAERPDPGSAPSERPKEAPVPTGSTETVMRGFDELRAQWKDRSRRQ